MWQQLIGPVLGIIDKIIPDPEQREKLAQEIALNTEINAMDAQHLMKSAPKDEPEKSQSSSFERVMSSIPNPEIAPDGDDHIATADTVADRIASTR